MARLGQRRAGRKVRRDRAQQALQAARAGLGRQLAQALFQRHTGAGEGRELFVEERQVVLRQRRTEQQALGRPQRQDPYAHVGELLLGIGRRWRFERTLERGP